MFLDDLKAPSERAAVFGKMGEWVGRIAAPIRAKLLISFVGIAILMVLLALTGIHELRKANQRASALINDQAQMTRLNGIQLEIQNTILAGTELLTDEYASAVDLANESNRLAHLARANVISSERASGVLNKKTSEEISEASAEILDIANRIISLFNAGEIEAVRLLLDNQFIRKLRALERQVVKLTFAVRKSMNQRASVNEEAFQRSQWLVISVSTLMVFLALVLGYSISSSIIQPMGRIRAALRNVAQGDFAARADVQNRDEIGDLADRVNRTTEQLGTAYKKLEAANQHKSLFLANMSHEFRTPMNSILGYTELIQDGIYGAVPKKILEPLERIDANGKALLSLINDVLDVSKIEAGQLELQLGTYDMADVAETVRATVAPLVADKDLSFDLDISPSLPPGIGDSARIHQILLNVVGNAVKFTDEGGVTLAVSEADGNFVLSVSDTGPGITKEEQTRIFGEFHQADSSTTRAAGGTGLGLSISRQLAELHGGSIDVESEPGQGARFIIVLPITADRAGGAT